MWLYCTDYDDLMTVLWCWRLSLYWRVVCCVCLQSTLPPPAVTTAVTIASHSLLQHNIISHTPTTLTTTFCGGSKWKYKMLFWLSLSVVWTPFWSQCGWDSTDTEKFDYRPDNKIFWIIKIVLRNFNVNSTLCVLIKYNWFQIPRSFPTDTLSDTIHYMLH